MMTPLQEWFFMNVEENVPSAEECRDRFDYEFDDRIECLTAKVRQFFAEFSDEVTDGERSDELFATLIKEVQDGAHAAKLECDYTGLKLEFPSLFRHVQILTKILQDLGSRR
jgi:hypothetical protein